MSEPDTDTVLATSKKAARLAEEGKLTRELYDDLYKRAKLAAAGRGYLLEGILMTGLELGFVSPS